MLFFQCRYLFLYAVFLNLSTIKRKFWVIFRIGIWCVFKNLVNIIKLSSSLLNLFPGKRSSRGATVEWSLVFRSGAVQFNRLWFLARVVPPRYLQIPCNSFVHNHRRLFISQNATVMPVPSAFNDLEDLSLRDHVGWVWYQRSEFIPARMSKGRTYIRLDSVNYYAKVVSSTT